MYLRFIFISWLLIVIMFTNKLWLKCEQLPANFNGVIQFPTVIYSLTQERKFNNNLVIRTGFDQPLTLTKLQEAIKKGGNILVTLKL